MSKYFGHRLLYYIKHVMVDRLCWGLTTHQPLWVILCCLPEKGRREIEEIVEEMKESGTGEKDENE